MWALIVGLSALAAACSQPAGFPQGSGTASVTWHRLAGAPGVEQPYSGTIAGQPVRGTAVIPQPTSFTNLILGKWTGTFEDKSFTLTVSASLTSGLGSLSSGSSPTLTISGAYGTWKVKGTATEVGSSNVASFTGTVGPHHVSGTITSVSEGQGTASATARFTVAS